MAEDGDGGPRGFSSQSPRAYICPGNHHQDTMEQYNRMCVSGVCVWCGVLGVSEVYVSGVVC